MKNWSKLALSKVLFSGQKIDLKNSVRTIYMLLMLVCPDS